MAVLRLDASLAHFPEDLNIPLAEELGCEPTSLVASENAERPIRVIVDRCDCLFDQPWVDQWQEQWRALLTDPRSQGRVAAVLFGRPLFRQIAGGDASPLLNAGEVMSVRPLDQRQIELTYGFSAEVAVGILKKTGGHPELSRLFSEAVIAKDGDFRQAVRTFEKEHRAYVVEAVQDHPVGGRSMLGDLLRTAAPIHESALIQRHFESAHADGRVSLEDLCASGLVSRVSSGDCTIAADLLKNIGGMRDVVSAPEMKIPDFESKVMDAAWRCLFFSENALRKLVVDRLEATNAAWWILDVSPQVRAAAEGRRKADGAVAASEEPITHPIMYLTVSELFDVLFGAWDRVFAAVFSPVPKQTLQTMAREFEAVRNRLAHSRPVTEVQLREFEVLTDRLGLTRLSRA